MRDDTTVLYMKFCWLRVDACNRLYMKHTTHQIENVENISIKIKLLFQQHIENEYRSTHTYKTSIERLDYVTATIYMAWHGATTMTDSGRLALEWRPRGG